jgi:predicted dehydrogenase
MAENLRIGIAGAGGFAHFAANVFSKLPGVSITAVHDINETAAKNLAGSFNAVDYDSYEEMLKDTNVDLVYIATPPFLHYQQSKMALMATKHVICEKPAALHSHEAEELAALASHDLLYVVNLMQRYNPLYQTVKSIISEQLLGNFLHGFFENYASDENLAAAHWFWDDAKSGGIFIEHGVHFFDMFEGWLGEGKLLQSLQLQRPNVEKTIVDRVQATVLYDGGIVNFYHSFDQPKILDRQEMRLEFERGEITLYEWVPVKMKLHGLLNAQQSQQLKGWLQNFSQTNHGEPSEDVKNVRGRFKDIHFTEHVTIEYGNAADKQSRYEQLLADMLNDQWSWIRDKNHQRIIDASNAIQSLKMAEAASQQALKIIST